MTEVDFPKPRSTFLKVECSTCGKTQNIFGSPAQQVECTNCGETLAEPTGGKARIQGKIKKTLD